MEARSPGPALYRDFTKMQICLQKYISTQETKQLSKFQSNLSSIASQSTFEK